MMLLKLLRVLVGYGNGGGPFKESQQILIAVYARNVKDPDFDFKDEEDVMKEKPVLN